MSSLVDFRAREDELRRLDAELTSKKDAVVRRAEELVRQQADRLARMNVNEQHQQQPSYDRHTFETHDQGFLDETTGYRGRVENVASRPTSAIPTNNNTAAPGVRSYSRPVSAATQEGRRRSSGIPNPSTTSNSTATAAASSSSALSRVSSASRLTPSSLPSSSSRPQSRVARQTATTSSQPSQVPNTTFTRASSYGDQESDYDVPPSDVDYIDDVGGANGGDAVPSDNIPLDDVGLDGLDLPQGAMGSGATIRFQKARIQALTTSVTTLTTTLAEREKELSDLKLLLKNGNDSREKLLRSKEALEKSSSQSSKLISELEAKLAHSEGESSGLRREQQQVEKRRKELETESKSKDMKLNRCLAELERCKEQVARMKSGGGGGGGGGGAGSEDVQRELSALRLGNKKLLQQRTDLLVGFKKQQKLIEILKKQKLHIELAKMLSFTEEEFAKSLETGEI